MMNIINDIINHWRYDWCKNRTLFWYEFLGTFLSLAGTATMSILAAAPPMITAYSIWLAGSISMSIGAYIRGASWMLTLMVINTIFNIVGLTVLMLK
jgi:Ca2+/Na+ antiporter